MELAISKKRNLPYNISLLPVSAFNYLQVIPILFVFNGKIVLNLQMSVFFLYATLSFLVASIHDGQWYANCLALQYADWSKIFPEVVLNLYVNFYH